MAKVFVFLLLVIVIHGNAEKSTMFDLSNALVKDSWSQYFSYYGIPDLFSADDGNVFPYLDGLRLDSFPFRKSLPSLTPISTLDHVKFLVYLKNPIEIPTSGFLTISTTLRTNVTGQFDHPFGNIVTNPDDDFRLANGVISIIDDENMLIFDFLVTDTKIFVVYERLPFGRTPENHYAAFLYVIPVSNRNENDFDKLEIKLNGKDKTVEYYVNQTVVYKLYKIGYRLSPEFCVIDLGGIEQSVFPKSMKAGFGTFTILDAYPACVRDEQSPHVCQYNNDIALVKLNENHYDPRISDQLASYYDGEGIIDNKIWGQGVQLELTEFRVVKDCEDNEDSKELLELNDIIVKL